MSPGFDRFLPFVGIYILSLIGIVFGLVLLIIPGIMLMVRWTPLMSLVVDRQSGAFDAFGDSWEMTRGRGWSIFGAAIILAILMAIASAVLNGLALFGGSGGTIIASAVQAVTDQVSTVLFAGFAVGAWRLMRDNREDLAEVFE